MESADQPSAAGSFAEGMRSIRERTAALQAQADALNAKNAEIAGELGEAALTPVVDGLVKRLWAGGYSAPKAFEVVRRGLVEAGLPPAQAKAIADRYSKRLSPDVPIMRGPTRAM